MKISIIIPTLNEGKLLPKLLDQLNDENLRSTFDYEIIISDGGSEDDTIENSINRVDKIIVHQDDEYQNIATGRNAGAEVSAGNILIFLNGDILIDDPLKFFNSVFDFAKSDYLAMTCSVIVNPEESKLIDSIFLGFYNWYFHMLNVIGVGMGRGECHVIKRSVFEMVGGYKENLAAGEDFDLYKRIRRKGKILFLKNIHIWESPRRYRKLGHFNIFFRWLFNSIAVIFWKRSISKEWKQVR